MSPCVAGLVVSPLCRNQIWPISVSDCVGFDGAGVFGPWLARRNAALGQIHAKAGRCSASGNLARVRQRWLPGLVAGLVAGRGSPARVSWPGEGKHSFSPARGGCPRSAPPQGGIHARSGALPPPLLHVPILGKRKRVVGGSGFIFHQTKHDLDKYAILAACIIPLKFRPLMNWRIVKFAVIHKLWLMMWANFQVLNCVK